MRYKITWITIRIALALVLVRYCILTIDTQHNMRMETGAENSNEPAAGRRVKQKSRRK